MSKLAGGFIDDLLVVVTGFSAMAGAYCSMRMGKDRWKAFIDDLETGRAISVSDTGADPERAIALDHIIDDIMLYWLPAAGPSSARFYWESMGEMAGGRPTEPIPLPAGVSMFPGEQVRLSRRWAERLFADLRFFGEAEQGGHFAAMENPAVFIEHVCETFRRL